MEKQLTDIEVRVLGVLIEKEMTTPDYYPLSLNALQAGCNQKSSRDPVVHYSENEILLAIDSLKEKRFVWQLSTTGSRVPKYEHNIKSIYPLNEAEIAVLCILMLRGPQTAGEIRNRSDRMYSFSSIEMVITALNSLTKREVALVNELPRIPGHKENRWMHLLSGEEAILQFISQASESDVISLQSASAKDRVTVLEEQVERLEKEIISIRNEFEEFKKQFQ